MNLCANLGGGLPFLVVVEEKLQFDRTFLRPNYFFETVRQTMLKLFFLLNLPHKFKTTVDLHVKSIKS